MDCEALEREVVFLRESNSRYMAQTYELAGALRRTGTAQGRDESIIQWAERLLRVRFP